MRCTKRKWEESCSATQNIWRTICTARALDSLTVLFSVFDLRAGRKDDQETGRKAWTGVLRVIIP